jgi:hypothetical protein
VLLHGPTPGDGQCQHGLNGGRLDDEAQGLVHPEALGEHRMNPTSLVLA